MPNRTTDVDPGEATGRADSAGSDPTRTADPGTTEETTPYGRQAYRILQLGFVAAPILAGLDKFFYLMTDWTKYLAPFLADLAGATTFMSVVGVVEIIAGIGVALRPRLFSYVVAAWLVGIIGSLLLTGGYLDVALRDLGLVLGALALGRLSHAYASN